MSRSPRPLPGASSRAHDARFAADSRSQEQAAASGGGRHRCIGSLVACEPWSRADVTGPLSPAYSPAGSYGHFLAELVRAWDDRRAWTAVRGGASPAAGSNGHILAVSPSGGTTGAPRPSSGTKGGPPAADRRRASVRRDAGSGAAERPGGWSTTAASPGAPGPNRRSGRRAGATSGSPTAWDRSASNRRRRSRRARR